MTESGEQFMIQFWSANVTHQILSVSGMSKKGIQAVLGHKYGNMQKGSNRLTLTCSGDLDSLRAKMVRDDYRDCAPVMQERRDGDGDDVPEDAGVDDDEPALPARQGNGVRCTRALRHRCLPGISVHSHISYRPGSGGLDTVRIHLSSDKNPKDRIGSAPLLTPLLGCALLWGFTFSESAVSASTLFTILPCRDQESLCLTGVTVFPVPPCPSPSLHPCSSCLSICWNCGPFLPSFPFPLRVMASMSMGAAPLCSCPHVQPTARNASLAARTVAYWERVWVFTNKRVQVAEVISL